MIVSFHPIIEGDLNLLCAGRPPGQEDLAAIRNARAVILPQGCSEALYRMARRHCAQVFPNLDARFDYPGKLNQIGLFRRLGLAHPDTRLFTTVAQYHRSPPRLDLPVVLKLDWGGQGDTVFRIDTPDRLAEVIARVQAFEHSGQFGFMLQRFVPHAQRALRVTCIGAHMRSYWRIQPQPDHFGTCVSQGSRIDHQANPELQAAACKVAAAVCARTGLQLAGFDFIFDRNALEHGLLEPLILEINYFFGRTGLGGSEAYYDLLTHAVDLWLRELGLARPSAR